MEVTPVVPDIEASPKKKERKKSRAKSIIKQEKPEANNKVEGMAEKKEKQEEPLIQIPEITLAAAEVPRADESTESAPINTTNASSGSVSGSATDRRASIIQRRMSLSRRKSLASASIDEINEILKELGPEMDDIEDENEEDSEFLDAQIQSILDDYKRKQSISVSNSAIEDDDEDELFNKNVDIKEEEDEIDKLVKQHNLSQGVALDENFEEEKVEEAPAEAPASLPPPPPPTEPEVSDLGELSGLDQEIASLAPLIDAHHQDLLRGNNSNTNKKKAPFTIHQPPARSTPLMGKPAVPRMGRPASIQPPASRLYGRTAPGKGNSGNGAGNTAVSNVGALTKAQLVNNRLTTTNSPLAGLPTHLVAQGSPGLPLKVAHGNLMTSGAPIYKPVPPKQQHVLEVPPVYIDDTVPKKEEEEVSINSNFGSDVSAITTPLLVTNIKVLKVCHQKAFPELTMPPKYPRKRKDLPPQHIRKPTNNKKVYSLEEVPEQYRIKPTLSYSLMISNVLKTKGTPQGLSASDVSDCIKEAYPFYKYCADGWQFSINHNLALNRIFKKISHTEENEWTWGLDETYINERERVRMKQQEIAAAKAKAAALKAEELKQKQRLEAQQAAAQNIATGRPGFSPYSNLGRIPQSQFISQLHQQGGAGVPPNLPPGNTVGGVGVGGKPKTIAELASEIRREGLVGSKAPLYFKPAPNNIPPSAPDNSIKAQLAANRASVTPPAPGAAGEHLRLIMIPRSRFLIYKRNYLPYIRQGNYLIIQQLLQKSLQRLLQLQLPKSMLLVPKLVVVIMHSVFWLKRPHSKLVKF